jgi:2-polyprenyl-3-methyl-5-hydroxy-6-metoxy-1,4-benzoquinol methylase
MISESLLKMTACPFCATHRCLWLCAKEDRHNEQIHILRCSVCDLLFVCPFPNDLQDLYNHNYFRCDSPLKGGYENYENDEPEIKKTFERRLPLFLPPAHSNLRRQVLDIGCATGVFLEVMRERGWQTRGVELSEFGTMRSKKKGFDVFQGDLISAPFERASFDLITLWDVIEHIPNPLIMLKTCYQLLKPDGYLILSTPDSSALLARLLGTYWLGFRSAGEHLYFFSRDTIRNYLSEAGFGVVKMHAIGKYLKLDRLIRRLGYYTRIFERLQRFPNVLSHDYYFNSGDTMCVIAQRKEILRETAISEGKSTDWKNP